MCQPPQEVQPDLPLPVQSVGRPVQCRAVVAAALTTTTSTASMETGCRGGLVHWKSTNTFCQAPAVTPLQSWCSVEWGFLQVSRVREVWARLERAQSPTVTTDSETPLFSYHTTLQIVNIMLSVSDICLHPPCCLTCVHWHAELVPPVLSP